MVQRALLTPDELKSLPKGTFIVMKTGTYPMTVKLKLFFKWGIVFPKEVYTVADRGNRMVEYADKKAIEAAIEKKYPKPKTADSDEAERIDRHSGRVQSIKREMQEVDIAAIRERGEVELIDRFREDNP